MVPHVATRAIHPLGGGPPAISPGTLVGVPGVVRIEGHQHALLDDWTHMAPHEAAGLEARNQRETGGRKLSPFAVPVGGSSPHSWCRWASATRIRGAGEHKLSALTGPVIVSYPHSGSRQAQAIRIGEAGGRQLLAFGEPAGPSYPH